MRKYKTASVVYYISKKKFVFIINSQFITFRKIEFEIRNSKQTPTPLGR